MLTEVNAEEGDGDQVGNMLYEDEEFTVKKKKKNDEHYNGTS